jgi:hypothetical protein
MKATIAIVALLLAAGAGAQWRGSDGPFTRDESDLLAEVWPQIREAARFGDINWRAYGLSRAPGDPEARDMMADNWQELRQARRFDDIDWEDYGGFRDLRSDRDLRGDRDRNRDRRFAGGFGGGVGDGGYGSPFTRDEEAAISSVWGEVRKAAQFDDINWRAVGLSRAPGSRDARRLMAQHWGQLREAARFEDIDWAATTGQPRRVLR